MPENEAWRVGSIVRLSEGYRRAMIGVPKWNRITRSGSVEYRKTSLGACSGARFSADTAVAANGW